jgi:hypothetical protein
VTNPVILSDKKKLKLTKKTIYTLINIKDCEAFAELR